MNEIQTCTLHDPAKVTVNPKNADTAIVSIGVNTKRRKIYIRDVAYGKMHPDEQYEAACKQIRKYDCELLGVEENSLHEFIEYPFDLPWSHPYARISYGDLDTFWILDFGF